MKIPYTIAILTTAGVFMAIAAGSPSSVVSPNGFAAGIVAQGEPRLHAPPGFAVTEFAAGIRGARFMALGPDGAVYVSQPESHRVTRLFDANNDGVAESQTIAVDGLNRPHGLAFHNGFLYIANTDGVVRVKLDVNGTAIGTPEQLNTYSTGGGHWTRTIIFGADKAMYVSIGSSCNLCVEKDSDRAVVMRYDENGKHGKVFSKGLRNAVGLAMHPITREIWVTQNERDNMPPDHEDLPPDEINILRDGGDYGWPYCWGDKMPSPEFNNPARCASTIPPALALQAHSAPLGMTFLAAAKQFPRAYRGDLLVAYHGSWNRKIPTGAKVVRIMIDKNNMPTRVEDFVTGWQDARGNRWGRPVDVLVYKDGSVLISDDLSGQITRVAVKP